MPVFPKYDVTPLVRSKPDAPATGMSGWLTHPVPQYVPLSNVGFAPYEPNTGGPTYQQAGPGAAAAHPISVFSKVAMSFPSIAQIFHGARNPQLGVG